ncbi:MAG: DsbA family protein [Pseudomonadota bacterium]
MRVQHYFDYKSPYAYLAQQDTFALLELPNVELELIPYTLDIPAYLGSAEVSGDGEVLAEVRNAHQWRRVRYAYMDCRREANRRGVTVRGPRKIFDSTLAHKAFLFVAERGDERQTRDFHMRVFEKFWRRELDIEQVEVMAAQIVATGIDAAEFEAFAAGAGEARRQALQTDAETNGVFGVPSYLLDGELYWGTERLERVLEHIRATPAPA